MLLHFLLFFSGIILRVTTSDYLQNCKNTKVEENVTLRGGIGAGTFRKLAKVTSMASCIELCCKTSTCDVAFLSDLKCYGVECVSDDECESTATDTSDTKVLIAHVRTGSKKENKSLALAGIPTHNSPQSFLQNVGKQDAIKPAKQVLPGAQISTINTLAKDLLPSAVQGPALGLANPQPISVPEKLPAFGVSASQAPAVSKQQSATTAKSKTPLINPGMAGQCKPGKTHKQVTLKGGINAGTYKDVGAVKDIEDCSKKCCGFSQCDLAFVLRSRCYLVECTDGKSCQIQKAKTSPYNPSIVYVSRWNSEGVKHTINVNDDLSSQFMCSPMKLMTKVTLKGGLKAGDFTDTGKVGSIGECYDLCCHQASCNLAFMLGQNCFSVKCYNKDLCSTIPAQPSIYNPQIAYVWNRKEMPHAEKVVKAPIKSEIPQSAAKCPKGKIEEHVTLVGGLNAGSFHDNGKVKDIVQCRRICCEMPKCNLAFMLGASCFSVSCKNSALCKTQPAKPSQFFPKISYVRNIGSTAFLGSEPFNVADEPDVPVAAAAVPVPAAATKQNSILTAEQPPKPEKPELPGEPPVIPAIASKPPQTATQLAGPPTGISEPGVLSLLKSAPVAPQGQPQGPQLGQPQLPVFSQSPLPLAANLNAMQNSLIPQPADAPPVIPGLPPPSPQQSFGMSPQQLPGLPLMQPGMDSLMPQSPLAGIQNPAQKPEVPEMTTEINKPPKIPPKVPEADKTMEVSKKPGDKLKGINLKNTINKAMPGQAMKMKIVDGKLQLTPVGTSAESSSGDGAGSGTAKAHASETSGGAFDAILGGGASDDKCMQTKVMTDVTLKGGKKAGKFKDHGDVKNMKTCKQLCCKDKECNLAFMLEKTCYTVTCKNKGLCNHTPAPPSDFRPRLSYVRPLGDSDKESDDLPAIPKEPKNLRCKHSNITNDKTLSGNMHKSNFTVLHDVDDMGVCMTKCCENKKCDVAYYTEDKCYAVSCTTKDACKPISAKGKGNTALMSAMTMRPQDEEDDVTNLAAEVDDGKSSISEEVTNLQARKQHCRGNRISSGVTLRGGNKASNNFTSMGKVDNIKMCIALCCIRPSCDIAYMENNKCFAVDCNDGVLCQTAAHEAELGMKVKLAYMDRNKSSIKERDWMIVYIIVGSLAFAAGIGGVIWGVCVCSKRNKLKKQRRLLDDEDEDDEMLPKPTQTRYRTPMHRY